MLAVLFAVLAGALFGVFTLAVRAGLTRGADPEAGALVITGLGFLVGAALALPELASGASASPTSGPSCVVGAIVPGVSQILFILAVRDAGPSRAAILIGTAPLISVLIALLVLGEPFRPLLLAGTALIVAGGAILARERARPGHFRVLGAVLALTCAALFAVRDNAVRFVARDADAPPLAASAASLLGASAVVLLYLLIVRRRGLPAKLRAALPAFAAAGVTLGLAYASLVEAFDHGRVSVVAPLNATQSLWAVLLAAVLIGRSEHIGRRTVLSGAARAGGRGDDQRPALSDTASTTASPTSRVGGAAADVARARPFPADRLEGVHHGPRRLRLAEMVEHQRGAPDRADRIGDSPSRDVRRGAVHRLEQAGRGGARREVRARRRPHPALDRGGEVGEDVGEEVRGDDDVEAARVAHHPAASASTSTRSSGRRETRRRPPPTTSSQST